MSLSEALACVLKCGNSLLKHHVCVPQQIAFHQLHLFKRHLIYIYIYISYIYISHVSASYEMHVRPN